MLRKQRKLQPWRRFGYVILIIIKSGELLLWFSPRIINGLRSYIKHSKGCFIRYPNTLKLVKKNSAAPRFLNHFSVFGYRMKHSSSCLIYYIKYLILLRPGPRPRRVHKPIGLMQSVIFVCLFVFFWVITSKHISHYYVKSIIVHSINIYLYSISILIHLCVTYQLSMAAG